MLFGMSGASETRSPKSNPLNGFEETVKDFWISRPRRPHTGRKLAGVAAAIGNRYGIDPVVVRVALVATAVFGGFGFAFYLLGWLFLPAEGEEVSGFEGLIGRGRSSVSPAFAVVLSILVLSNVGWAFTGAWSGDSWFNGGGLIGLALIAIALYLLHRNRGHENRPAPLATTSYSTAYTGNGAFTMTDTATETPAPSQGWDPLAADPSGWDLPDTPGVPEPPQPLPPPPVYERRQRSKVGSATFGLAVLTAGAGVLGALNDVPWFSAQHIVGMVLGVVGIGLVVGAFTRGGRGLIGLAVPLSIAGMVLTSVPFQDFNLRGGFGDLNATPTSVADLKPLYQRSAGNIDLDLTKVPVSDPYSTTVSNGAGNTTVIVPDNADVTYDCKTGAGNTTCFTHSTSGLSEGALTGTDFGTDGPGGQKITLHVTNVTGDVEVRRD